MQGIIIGNIANTYKIKIDTKEYEAYARGKLKSQEVVPLVGDTVEISITDEENKKAIIEQIMKRKNEIKRPKIANIDQIIFIISTQNPKPDLLMLDKQLAYVEKLKIEPVIIINKIDLEDNYKQIQDLYAKIGYKTIVTSAKQKIGIDKVKECLKNKISVFSGNSGVGKSSIINAIFGIDKNTFIADTPGFSSFEIKEIQSNELEKYFREFKPEIINCEYVGCTHIKEQSCGIKKAVEEGRISQERYERFCKIYEELKNIEKHRW